VKHLGDRAIALCFAGKSRQTRHLVPQIGIDQGNLVIGRSKQRLSGTRRPWCGRGHWRLVGARESLGSRSCLHWGAHAPCSELRQLAGQIENLVSGQICHLFL
jgi:hypothetical protein